jgi:hypothetical protein
VISAVAIGLIVLMVSILVYQRITSEKRTNPEMGRVFVTVLVVILLLTVFVVAVRFFGVGGPIPTESSGPAPANNMTVPGTQPNQTGYVNGTGSQVVLFPNVPYWVPFVALAVAVLLVAVIAIPQTRRYLALRRSDRAAKSRPINPDAEALRAALGRAAADLDQGGDPRAVILGLYADLLAHLEPMVGDIGTRTPEEIRADHLVRLRVRPAAAATLTRLFEEARYSTHPMGPDSGARAEEAVRAALDDLARRTAVG